MVPVSPEYQVGVLNNQCRRTRDFNARSGSTILHRFYNRHPCLASPITRNTLERNAMITVVQNEIPFPQRECLPSGVCPRFVRLCRYKCLGEK